MARKSKQAGSGHYPLTNYERKEYGKSNGTHRARLAGASQHTFGNCALSLHPAKEEPVASPSGYVYERQAILEYLLHQTQNLKQSQQRYEQWLQSKKTEEIQEHEQKRKLQVEKFEDSQKVVAKKQKITEQNPLKRSSFWLAEFQPTKDGLGGGNQDMEPPLQRPPSPMSQKPLRRKDLIPLELKRNKNDQVVCAISEKSIVTQQALALITKPGLAAQVVLEQVYDDLGKEKVCPVTGQKIAKILKLQKGGSSFAASGAVMEAATYRPNMI